MAENKFIFLIELVFFCFGSLLTGWLPGQTTTAPVHKKGQETMAHREKWDHAFQQQITARAKLI